MMIQSGIKEAILSRRNVMQMGGLGILSLPLNSHAIVDSPDLIEILDRVDLGVASGDPDQSSVVLWTRIPLRARDNISTGSVNVEVEVASSPNFNPGEIICKEQVLVDESTFYNIKYLAQSLNPDTYYYYRFRTGNGYESMIGRTKTLPSFMPEGRDLKIAIASCQNYFAGYYHAYRAITENNYDFCVHLGDFIYEYGGVGVRSDVVANFRSVTTLDEYRAKYMLYLSDPDLQKARAWFPWFYIWDDHEVKENYSIKSLSPELIAKKTQAYRCYDDFMPIRANIEFPSSDLNPHLPLYRSVKIDDICDIIITDLRQYRTPKHCVPGTICPTLTPPSMLGLDQKAWFFNQIGSSSSTWKLIMNEVMFMPFKALSVNGLDSSSHSILNNFYLNRDGWDGFGAERKEITDFYLSEGIQNVVYCTGDIHNFYAGIIHRHPEDIKSEPVAYELVTASISSPGLADLIRRDLQSIIKPVFYKANPYVQYAELKYHGYMDITLNRHELHCRFMAVDSIVATKASAFELISTTIHASQIPSLSITS